MDLNKNEILVTIAIPFFNSERFLADAILSVINQTYQNWELLLMDDHGSDSSFNIAKYFSSLDKRIRIISDGENRGLAYRLNQSVILAKGEIYIRMDDDDIMVVNRVEKQVSYLLDHPELDVIGSSAMIIDCDNNIVRSANMKGRTNGFLHPTVAGRTEWFRLNKYDEKCYRCQDLDLWLRTLNTSKFYNLEIPLLFYREIGIPTLDKYLKSQKALRYILKKYKSFGKSYFWYLRSYIFTYIKEGYYCFFFRIGRIDYLLSKRKRLSLPNELLLNENDLKSATSIK